MSLVFAAFTPHPPLLLETLGGSQKTTLEKTREAFLFLSEELYLARPEVIVIITPHGSSYDNAYGILGTPKIQTDLTNFGDAITRKVFTNDLYIVSRITEACKKENLRSSLIPMPILDYGSSISLLLINNHANIRIVCIHTARTLPNKTNIYFGYTLKGVLMQSNKRIALIATGDLSHSLETRSPGGYHKDAVIFEKRIKEIIITSNTIGLLNINQELIKNAASCALNPLLVLFGVLGRMKMSPQILSHETAYGVGYMTVYFPLD